MNNNLPYQKQLKAGRFKVIQDQYDDPEGHSHLSCRTLLTGKGLVFIQKLLPFIKEHK